MYVQAAKRMKFLVFLYAEQSGIFIRALGKLKLLATNLLYGTLFSIPKTVQQILYVAIRCASGIVAACILPTGVWSENSFFVMPHTATYELQRSTSSARGAAYSRPSPSGTCYPPSHSRPSPRVWPSKRFVEIFAVLGEECARVQ